MRLAEQAGSGNELSVGTIRISSGETANQVLGRWGHGCETWSLLLTEEHRLRVFENRMLRRMFGPKRDEVKGGWRKLHNEERHNLYSSQVQLE
jgi:hypothetical protein